MLTLVCIFCCSVAMSLYGYIGEPDGLPAVGEVIASFIFPSSIALWVARDAARRGRPLPYDLPSWICVFWPLAAPLYLFRTRGIAGCGPMILFLVAIGVALLIDINGLFSTEAAR